MTSPSLGGRQGMSASLKERLKRSGRYYKSPVTSKRQCLTAVTSTSSSQNSDILEISQNSDIPPVLPGVSDPRGNSQSSGCSQPYSIISESENHDKSLEECSGVMENKSMNLQQCTPLRTNISNISSTQKSTPIRTFSISNTASPSFTNDSTPARLHCTEEDTPASSGLRVTLKFSSQDDSHTDSNRNNSQHSYSSSCINKLDKVNKQSHSQTLHSSSIKSKSVNYANQKVVSKEAVIECSTSDVNAEHKVVPIKQTVIENSASTSDANQKVVSMEAVTESSAASISPESVHQKVVPREAVIESTAGTSSSNNHKVVSKETVTGSNANISITSVGNPDTSTSLQEQKQTWAQRIAKKEEQLRKLKLVKMYRAKNDLDQLEGLIDKWRGVSQEALQALWDLTPEPKPSLTQLVDHLQLDHQFIQYNAEEESFD